MGYQGHFHLPLARQLGDQGSSCSIWRMSGIAISASSLLIRLEENYVRKCNSFRPILSSLLCATWFHPSDIVIACKRQMTAGSVSPRRARSVAEGAGARASTVRLPLPNSMIENSFRNNRIIGISALCYSVYAFGVMTNFVVIRKNRLFNKTSR